MTALDVAPAHDRPLTRHELALLRFSARHGLAETPHEELVLATWEAFGLGLVQFRQQLSTVVRLPAAEAAEPAEVRRLRRLLHRRPRRAAPHPHETRST